MEKINISLIILLIASCVCGIILGGNNTVKILSDNTLQVGLSIIDKLSDNINTIVLTLINCYTLSRIIKQDKDNKK